MTTTSDPKPAPNQGQLSHIIVVTRDELEQLGDILDNPFLTLTDQQKALFVKGYRLVKI